MNTNGVNRTELDEATEKVNSWRDVDYSHYIAYNELGAVELRISRIVVEAALDSYLRHGILYRSCWEFRISPHQDIGIDVRITPAMELDGRDYNWHRWHYTLIPEIR